MPQPRRSAVTLAAAAAIAATAGCSDPYAGATAPSSPPGQEALPPRPSGEPPPLSAAATPEAAVRRAAALTGTWSASTYADRHARFARQAIGEARTGAALAAARARTGDLAERSSTRVAAVTQPRRGSRSAELVLLLRERTYSHDGRRSNRWRVVEATVARLRTGWVVSRWAAQP